MTVTERAYRILLQHGPMRGSDLGWHLWGDTTECADRGIGSHGHNKFCRPAGKLLKAMERSGRVRMEAKKGYVVWWVVQRTNVTEGAGSRT